MPPRVPRLARFALALASALFVAYVVRAVLGLGGAAGAEIAGRWGYGAVKALVLVAVLARVVHVPERRGFWILIACWMALALAGDQVWQLLYRDDGRVPSPSAADPFYVCGYAMLLVAVVSFAARFERHVGPARLLDGLAAGLAVAAIGVAVVLEPGAGPAMQPVYPTAQLLVLVVLLGVAAIRGWRVDARWLMHVAGTLAYVAADAAAVRVLEAGTYTSGGLLETGWLLAVLLWGAAAWTPPTPLFVHRREHIDVLLPLSIGLAATGTLALAGGGNGLVTALAAGALVATLARAGLTAGENLRLLGRSRREALTDSLTAIGNRRRLLADLESISGPRLLVLFDLDGFKHFNDTFGHAGGDALLRRTAERLAAADGVLAYRMGGDEFCVLAAPAPGVPAAEQGRALAALLTYEREGVWVTASSGTAELPREGTAPADLLKLADRRMYAVKRDGRTSAERQSADALVALLAEREPLAAARAAEVAWLARAVGHRLGLDPSEVERIARAAQLAPAGPAVLAAAPALAPVAELLAARDGAHGPVGARVLAVATRLVTSTGDGADALDAIAELYRGAGARLDPAVVDAVAAVLHERVTEGLTAVADC